MGEKDPRILKVSPSNAGPGRLDAEGMMERSHVCEHTFAAYISIPPLDYYAVWQNHSMFQLSPLHA